MRAASLNFRDLAILNGKYFRGPLTQDTIPLSDGAGEVAAVGAASRSSRQAIASSRRSRRATLRPRSARRSTARWPSTPCFRPTAAEAAAALVLRGGRNAAVRRRDRLERADARAANLEGRRDGALARHGRRVDLRAADREDGRRARDRHVVERREARARPRARRRPRHQLQDDARLGEDRSSSSRTGRAQSTSSTRAASARCRSRISPSAPAASSASSAS